METLFLLRKKFINREIVRKINEYVAGSRKAWLKKYRDCIHYGLGQSTIRNIEWWSKFECETEYALETLIRKGQCGVAWNKLTHDRLRAWRWREEKHPGLLWQYSRGERRAESKEARAFYADMLSSLS